jgi:outer membrane protein assembly factor BamB
MSTMLRISLFAAVAMLAASPAAAASADWTQYGYTAEGRRENTHETILTRKSVSHLAQKWSASIPVGFSSAAVANGIVYVGSLDGHLYAFDATTGAPVWNAATGASICSSPAVADGAVYVGSGDGRVYAFDAETGAMRWATLAGYGAVWSAVTVADGLVYAGNTNGDMFAIKAKTGIVKWRAAEYRRGLISAPAVAQGIAYFAGDSGEFDAFDARTGAPLWQQFYSQGFLGAPAVGGGTAFGNFGGYILALDAKTGVEQWTSPTGAHGSIAIGGRHLYVGDDGDFLADIATATGAVKYTTLTGLPVEAAPAVANGVLYVGSLKNMISAYDTSNGNLLWQAPTGPVYAAPTVSNGMLYLGSSSQFNAYGLP